MTTNIKSLALQLEQARNTTTPTTQLNEAISIDDAYAIQAEMLRTRQEAGEAYIGPKLGFTSKSKMEQMGVSDIIVGFLTDEMWISADAPISLSGLIHPRIEPELVFKLSSAVVPAEDDDVQSLADKIIAATDSVAVGLEVIDSRYENFKFNLSDVVADNTSAARFIVGPWQAFPRDIGGLDVDFLIDGESVETSTTDSILGDPLEAFQHLASMTLRYDFKLPSEAIILAGSMTPAHWIHPGQQIKACVQGFPALSVTVEKEG